MKSIMLKTKERLRPEVSVCIEHNRANPIGRVRCSGCGGNPAGCPWCNGYGWRWADGEKPTKCPSSPGQTPCSRPMCWGCMNGARKGADLAEVRVYLAAVDHQRRT